MAQNRNQIVSSCDGREKVFKHGVRNFGNGGNSIKRIVHYKRVKNFPFSVQNGANTVNPWQLLIDSQVENDKRRV